MYKKFIFFLLIGFQFATAQTVSEITTTGRFNTCSVQPNIAIEFLPGSSGSEIIDGKIVCTDPCGVTKLRITVSDIRWNQDPGSNWFHGLFFPEGEGVSVSGIIMPAGWSDFPTCTGASCSAGVTGGQGFYFDASTGNSCCGGATLNDGDPSNNFGDMGMDCGEPVTVQFDLNVCNSTLTANTRTFTMRGTADGDTGCWSIGDNLTNTLNFTIETVPCDDTCTESCEETLGVAFDHSISDVQIFPNPSKGTFKFSEKVKNVTTYDASGKVVKTQTKTSTQLDLSHLPKGTYVIKGTTESGKSFTKKVVRN